MDMEQTLEQKPKKRGRPKLEEGQKGRYNLSRKQRVKLKTQKKQTAVRRKKAKSDEAKLKRKLESPTASKLLDQDEINSAPKSVQNEVKDR